MKYQGDSFVAEGSGSIVNIKPLTAACRRWMRKWLGTEPWQWSRTRGLAVDIRYADGIISAMQRNGL